MKSLTVVLFAFLILATVVSTVIALDYYKKYEATRKKYRALQRDRNLALLNYRQVQQDAYKAEEHSRAVADESDRIYRYIDQHQHVNITITRDRSGKIVLQNESNPKDYIVITHSENSSAFEEQLL